MGQGQRSLRVTHPLMLVIICAWYGKNPSRTVDVTERTRHAGRTDGRTDRRTDGVKPIYPPTTSLCGGYNNHLHYLSVYNVSRPKAAISCDSRLTACRTRFVSRTLQKRLSVTNHDWRVRHSRSANRHSRFATWVPCDESRIATRHSWLLTYVS